MDEHVKKSARKVRRRDEPPLATGFWRFWMYVEITIAAVLLGGLAHACAS